MRSVTERWVTCSGCSWRNPPNHGTHYCVGMKVNGEQKGQGVKHWNFELGCWAFMPAKGKTDWHHFQGIAYWNAKLGRWERDYSMIPIQEMQLVTSMYKDEGKGTVITVENTEEYEVASCEIPVQKVKGGESVKELVSSTTTYGSNYTYNSSKPWEGVDRFRFPSAWNCLVMQYYANDWHHGKYVSDEVYRDRILRAKYVPEPSWKSYVNMGQGYHFNYQNTKMQGETYSQWLDRTEKEKKAEKEDNAGNPYNVEHWE